MTLRERAALVGMLLLLTMSNPATWHEFGAWRWAILGLRWMLFTWAAADFVFGREKSYDDD